jgi:hypothetical protein
MTGNSQAYDRHGKCEEKVIMGFADSLYGSGGGGFIKGTDPELKERPILWIREVYCTRKVFKSEEGPKDQIVLEFFEVPDQDYTKRKMGLNKTQTIRLCELYGEPKLISEGSGDSTAPVIDASGWLFKGIRLYDDKTKIGNETKATVGIYPDPFEMEPAQLEQARVIREQVAAAKTQAASAVTQNAPSGFTGAAPASAPAAPTFQPSPGASSTKPSGW